MQACCAGWPADKVPGSADLELVREPQRFRLTSEEERSEWLFQTADAGILEEMCEEGYFNEGRPEDEVAFLLDDWDFEQLTEEQRGLYDERIHPPMRIWFFERERFEEEYARRRAACPVRRRTSGSSPYSQRECDVAIRTSINRTAPGR